MWVRLNLPSPSNSLIDQVIQYAKSVQFDVDGKRWLEEFHNGAITAALHTRGGNFNVDINRQINQEFQQFFPKHKFTSSVGIFKNNSDHAACLPPHIDQKRALGINYFVDLGGDQVETIFYNFSATTPPDKAINVKLNETGGILNKVRFDQGWYAFRTSQCHSVENIKTTRIYISIKILNGNNEIDADYDFDSFLNDYPELIKLQTQENDKTKN